MRFRCEGCQTVVDEEWLREHKHICLKRRSPVEALLAAAKDAIWHMHPTDVRSALTEAIRRCEKETP